ncbi:MAG TPA: type II 3-dehydroquinate dehydratase [Advenella sp.]|jgi:3-dehydroquinate dehydratase-2|uniref:3-dehydroquinate dehydratase n=2 Tax=Advenella TaxID=290425 RepID=A0A4Q7VSA3_9BURK|nr:MULTISPECIES: type II 3-dehydroquinate dehydratase [Advenella]RZT99421.1 3-dehydroquinate dehydratase [Advenella incenata]HBP28924.1 type II 3-dehydroquinate dehydratase [Advenella kashmirensis]HLU01394.1 type II 3-dehydroquinate dehydratase [Advenella sp.]
MTQKVLVLNGPNLNLLGTREPDVYGRQTLQDIHDALMLAASEAGVQCECFQSNHEGELVEKIQSARNNTAFIVINAAAYTHTSVALRDALGAVAIPFIEVHISNVHQRESFRHHSYLADKAVGVICGLGADGYMAALQYAIKHHLKQARKTASV